MVRNRYEHKSEIVERLLDADLPNDMFFYVLGLLDASLRSGALTDAQYGELRTRVENSFEAKDISLNGLDDAVKMVKKKGELSSSEVMYLRGWLFITFTSGNRSIEPIYREIQDYSEENLKYEHHIGFLLWGLTEDDY